MHSDFAARRLLVYLLLDCSGPMAGEPVAAMEMGQGSLLTDMQMGPQALETVWPAGRGQGHRRLIASLNDRRREAVGSRCAPTHGCDKQPPRSKRQASCCIYPEGVAYQSRGSRSRTHGDLRTVRTC